MFQLFALVDRPGLAQVLAALLADALLIGRVKVIHLDCQFTAHMIEQYFGDPMTRFGWRSRQRVRPVRPIGLRRTRSSSSDW